MGVWTPRAAIAPAAALATTFTVAPATLRPSTGAVARAAADAGAAAERGLAAEGRSAEGRSAEGRSAEGRSAEGRPAEGRSAEGRPAEGRSTRPAEGRTDAASWIVVGRLRGSIQPGSVRYIRRFLGEAERRGARLALLELDTPGGLVVSLREMTSALIASEVPVAVYVAPPGARAASAGFFLLLAADVAAMAPGTNAGAAHPIALGRELPSDDDSERETAPRDEALEKATQDAAALARALVERRGGSEAARQAASAAVIESRSYTADEARSLGLIDVVAPDRDALLSGLGLAGARVIVVEPSHAEKVLMFLADPEIAYLLLLVGVVGIVVELASPGIGLFGVVGAIALVLALLGFSVLPVNAVGALLLAAAIGFFVAEAFVASYGLLALAGLLCFVLGSMMLIDSPVSGLRISPWVILPAAAVVASLMTLVLGALMRARHARSVVGLDALVGRIGTVEVELQPHGIVFVEGEYWEAEAAHPLPRGARVRVTDVEGRRLRVEEAPI